MKDSVDRPEIERKAAKKYFHGIGLTPLLLIIVGIVLLVLGAIFIEVAALVFGLIAVFSGIILIVMAVFAAPAYEKEVDEIVIQEQQYLLSRGKNKLSVVEEEVSLIEPIIVIGASYQPDTVSSNNSNNDNFWQKIKKTATGGPIFVQKIGSDGEMRYSLIEFSIFFFGETELYIYFAHLDLTTGSIFHEGTHEYFYKDICGVTTEQVLNKAYNSKNRKYEDRLLEFINVYTYGCNHKSAFDSSKSNALLDEQFTAMRHLIRDKKEEKQGAYA